MIDFNALTIRNKVSPLASVMKSKGRNTLGSVLSRVRSSHEAVFIFNDTDEFLGLVSPFKTLYSGNFPYATEVSSIVFVPPAITKDAPIYKVAEHMLASKIYTLPVFSKKGVLQGVIHGKDLWQEIIANPDLLDFVSAHVRPHAPITAPITASVKDVFYALKEKGVSRMILVDAEGTLAGIVTRGDLMHTLLNPTDKMRFAKEGTPAGVNSFAGEKKSRKDEPVRTYHTILVDSLPSDTPKKEVVLHLLSSPRGSIVLVDTQGTPKGLLSMRDVLQALAQARPSEAVPITIKKLSSSVSDAELALATKHLKSFAKKMGKRMDIARIEVTSEEPKSPAGRTKVFNTTVRVVPVSGKAIVSVTKQRKFIDGVREATNSLEKQQRRGKK